MKLNIFQADAFTKKVFGGNPAAVCPLDSWLDGSSEEGKKVSKEEGLEMQYLETKKLTLFPDDEEEFRRHHDWGHSTWEECLRLCEKAGVKTPVIFHHLPSRTDTALDVIAAKAADRFPGAVVAREGETLTL